MKKMLAMKIRVADEAEYVLAVLYHMRDQVAAKPEMYGPDTLDLLTKQLLTPKPWCMISKMAVLHDQLSYARQQ